MSEQRDVFADITSIPYDQEQISEIVRRILFEARNRGEAVKLLVEMHRRLGGNVLWKDGMRVKFIHSLRSALMTFICDGQEITIDVCVTADEIQQ